MPRSREFTSSFVAGVVDPRLVARTDLDLYRQALRQGENITILPFGGVTRRPGTRYLGEVPGPMGLIEFVFNVDQTYCLVFTDQRLEVFRDDERVTNLNASGNDYMATPYTEADLAKLYYEQGADTVILTHEDHEPMRLVRGTAHNLWTLSSLPITSMPQFDYNDASSPPFTPHNQTITFNGTWEETDRYRLTLGTEQTSDIVYHASTSVNAERIREALLLLPNTGRGGITVAHLTGTSYSINLADDSADTFEAISGWGVSDGADGKVSGVVNQAGTSRKEDLWSAGRGFPRTCTFHGDRLWFAGIKRRPQTYAGSIIGDYFNFDRGRGLDDEAILRTIGTAQLNAIVGMLPAKRLQLFTSGGEFYLPDQPLTPALSGVVPQTSHGALPLKPVNVDGATLFIGRGGKQLREFKYRLAEDNFTADPVSLRASHLVSDAKDIATRRAGSEGDGNYVYVVNGDGSVGVYLTIRSEQIAAWTRWTTAGEILSMAVVDDTEYIGVKRTIDGVDRYFVERADASCKTDACVTVSGSGVGPVITGMDHLDGASCRVVADGLVQPDVVPAGGQVTLERTADQVEIGLGYTPLVQPMPLAGDYGVGPSIVQERRIIKARVYLYESLGVVVNDRRLADRKLDQDQLDTAPAPFTGWRDVPLMGWSKEQGLTITQPDPLPFTLLGLWADMEIKD